MTAFNVLGTVTGLVTVYLLLSLLCMAVNEYIQARLKYRARDLEKWIMSVFDAHANASNYNILALDATAATEEKAAKLAQDFADADSSSKPLADVAASAKAIATRARIIADAAKALASAGKLPGSAAFYADPLISSLFEFKTGFEPGSPLPQLVVGKPVKWNEKPAYIPSSTFALTLMHLVFPDIGSTATPKPDDYRTALQSLPDDSPLKPILQTLLNASGESLASFRSGIEGWFDAAMERVAGDYKRIMMRSLFWLGLVISLAVNADTFQFANSISKSTSLQQALGTLLPTLTGSDRKLPIACPIDQTPNASTVCTDAAKVIGELKAAGLPIGWTNPEFRPPSFSTPKVPANNGVILALWLFKIGGCVITAFAISVGAPFWFDVLNKIMVVRSTVKPAE